MRVFAVSAAGCPTVPNDWARCLSRHVGRRCALNLINATACGHGVCYMFQGIDFDESGVVLISSIIAKGLGIPCSVLMGANVANEVAMDEFCEATIGSIDLPHGEVYVKLFDSPRFRVNVVTDAVGELIGHGYPGEVVRNRPTLPLRSAFSSVQCRVLCCPRLPSPALLL